MQLPPLSQLQLRPALKRKFIHAGASLTLTSTAAQASPPPNKSRFMRCVPFSEVRSEPGLAAETRQAQPGKDSPQRSPEPSETAGAGQKNRPRDVFRRKRAEDGEKVVFG